MASDFATKCRLQNLLQSVNRLALVLHKIIDTDQTCSIPGRSIFNNLNLICDILNYIETMNETGILLSLDQEKAFDRVDRDFLLNALDSFGFGAEFQQWILTLYSGAFTKILVNGWLTTPVSLERGVRQGDPLSPLLYVITAEVLVSNIRANTNIRGFLLPGANGTEFKVNQYADDTTIFIKDISLRHLFQEVNKYEQGTGAKLNMEKTKAMWLGAWRNRIDTPFNVNWVHKLKLLGIWFGDIATELDNWKPKLEKLDKCLNLWKLRSLSLVGKSLIINTLGASKFWHLAKVLRTPKWVISEYNKLVWPFLWGSKIETVSQKNCCNSVKNGGLNVVDFSLKGLALHAASIVSSVDPAVGKSFYLARYYVGRRLAGINPRWSCLQSNATPNAQELTDFYNNAMKTLRQIVSKLRNMTTFVFSSRNCYHELLKESCTPILLTLHWPEIPSSNFSSKLFWARTRDEITENVKNDLIWLIVLHSIKVREHMHR